MTTDERTKYDIKKNTQLIRQLSDVKKWYKIFYEIKFNDHFTLKNFIISSKLNNEAKVKHHLRHQIKSRVIISSTFTEELRDKTREQVNNAITIKSIRETATMSKNQVLTEMRQETENQDYIRCKPIRHYLGVNKKRDR